MINYVAKPLEVGWDRQSENSENIILVNILEMSLLLQMDHKI